MSINSTGVFLASRFEEFSELRCAVKETLERSTTPSFKVIDLNDGSVSYRPPIETCLSHVRRSEIMVLLLGDTYGGVAPRTDKSFTHLEYEEAIKEGSATRVLVFCFGDSYSYKDKSIRFSDDPRLARWQEQLQIDHTLGFLDPHATPSEMAAEIARNVLSALYGLRFGAVGVDVNGGVGDDLFEASDEENVVDDSEVSDLDDRHMAGVALTGQDVVDADSADAAFHPAAVAAREQRAEAQRALDICEYGIAVNHLKRALEHRPLEMRSNFWLAQIYLAMGQKRHYLQAIELAERAGKLAEHENMIHRAAAAYVIAARCARLAERNEEAKEFVGRALLIAPRFSKVHVEAARQCIAENDGEAALEEIENAYRLFPRSLGEVQADPVFRVIREGIEGLKRKYRAEWIRRVNKMLATEKEMGAQSREAPSGVLEARSNRQLISDAQESSKRQWEYLVRLTREINRRYEAQNEAPPPEPAATVESMPFGRPGSIIIDRWEKQPGDVLSRDDVIFYYHFNGSGTMRPWRYKGARAVRIKKVAGAAGVRIASENPALFSHIDASYVKPERSNYQKDLERKAILEAEINDRRQRIYAVRRRLDAQSRSTSIFGWLARWLNPKLREYVAQCEADEARMQRELEHASAELHEVGGRVSTVKAEFDSLRDRWQKAMRLFEGATLANPVRLLKFASIYNAEAGMNIRARTQDLENFRKASSRKLTVEAGFPEWAEGMDVASSAALYRVTQCTPRSVTLSRADAYLGAVPMEAGRAEKPDTRNTETRQPVMS